VTEVVGVFICVFRAPLQPTMTYWQMCWVVVVKATFIGAASAAVAFGIGTGSRENLFYFLFKSRLSSCCSWYFQVEQL
jgi:hypothetical protein